MKTKKRGKRWHRTHCVATLIRRHEKPQAEPSWVMGPKRNGSTKGRIMLVGGKIKPREFKKHGFDHGRYIANKREAQEESRLRLLSAILVAVLHVRIWEKREIHIVYVYESSRWTGRLRTEKSKEFKWLRFFPTSRIPWKRLPCGDIEWMKKVILEGRRCKVWTHCGKDRCDLLKPPRIRYLIPKI